MDCVRRRGKVYNVVVTVPADLVGVIGKRQIWRSLKTKSYDIARSEARKLLVTVEQLFLRIRNDMDSGLINGMVAEFGLEWLEKADKARSFFAAINNSESKRHTKTAIYKAQVDRTQDQILSGKSTDVPGAVICADKYIDKYGLKNITAIDRNEVINSFAQAIKLTLKVEGERTVGVTETESDFQYRLLEKWNRDKIIKTDIGISLSDLLDEYEAQWVNDNPHRVKKKKKELARIKESFMECFCKVLGVKEIDEVNAIDWRNHLQYEYHSDRDLVMTNKSVDNYIKTVSAVMNWAMCKGKRVENCSKKPLQKYVDINRMALV